MIRFNKRVKLMEWGKGTNTTNQKWTEIGEGNFSNRSVKDGVTTLTIQTSAPLNRQNEEENAVKLCQQGEGMTGASERWGEVALGYIKNVAGTTVTVEIPTATKISGAANALEKFLGLP